MSTAPPASPPPTPPTAKKGLSPWAWVAIGCGAILIVAMIFFAVGGVWVTHKIKQAATRFEENPEMASAETAVKLNPDLEMVSEDEDAKTLTVRNKKTGEVLTVDLKDIRNGQLKFDQGKGEMTVGLDQEKGALTVTDQQGKTHFRMGAGGEADIPEWVPRYPGTSPEGNYAMSGDRGRSGAFTLTTADDPQTVTAYFEKTLKQAGFEVSKTTFSGEQTGALITGRQQEPERTLTLTIGTADDGRTSVTVSYSEGSGGS